MYCVVNDSNLKEIAVLWLITDLHAHNKDNHFNAQSLYYRPDFPTLGGMLIHDLKTLE